METPLLYVRMLGDFQIYWNGELLHFSIGSATKTMQFLQIILLKGKQGIKREQLVKYLFDQAELSDPANSLRVAHYRLKKILAESGLPKCDYIKIQKGRYCWNEALPLKTDAGEFLRLVSRAESTEDEEEKIKLQQEACSLYKGELLPMLGAEDWIISEGAVYKSAYIKTLNSLLAEMKRRGEYEAVKELAVCASQIYPYEEWQIYQIDSLISMGAYSEALEVYNKTSRLYKTELGITPSRNMLQLYSILSEKARGSADNIEDIRLQIEEQSIDTGAFYCSLLSFVDTCRVLNRIIDRSQQNMSLMLCTMRSQEYSAAVPQEYPEADLLMLKRIIQGSLRKGDFYTKYSQSQFLIFLIGTDKDEALTVSERIREKFARTYLAKKAALMFSSTSLREIDEKGLKI